MQQHLALLEINTRTWISERGAALGRAATLDDFTDEALARIAQDGYDWVWLLGVWRTGPAGREVSLHQPQWQSEYRELLGDFADEDVAGSPFAVCDYIVSDELGGPEALARLRKRLAGHGLKLMLDFVPNHTALDHPWVHAHPEYYIHGSEEDIAREPQNYRRIDGQVLALGRDPYFPGWPDTLQLNYRHRGLREAMRDVLRSIAQQCDGVRCDMAMLVLPEIILRTWGDRSKPVDGSPAQDDPFWPWAIEAVRAQRPDFVFMAEAYWDLEWTLQQQGFDYTYDKRLYDRLHGHDAAAVRGHLHADDEYQHHSVRFIENHDEPRAATAFGERVHEAAAVIALLAPGLHFVHEGQDTGRRCRTSNHLRRRAVEPIDREIEVFYSRLLSCMRREEVRDGDWHLLEPQRAWEGNATSDQFVAYSWDKGDRRMLVAVNYGPGRGQCYLRLPYSDMNDASVELHDCMHPAVTFMRRGDELAREGLYLDLPPWGHHVFTIDVSRRGVSPSAAQPH